MALVKSMTHITELAPSGSNRAVAVEGSVRIPTVLESIIADNIKLLPETEPSNQFNSDGASVRRVTMKRTRENG